MKKLSIIGIVGGAALLAAVPLSLQRSQETAVPLLTLSHGTFAECIVEPIDVLTMDIHIPMEGIILTPMEEEDTILTPTGDIIAHPISEDGLIN